MFIETYYDERAAVPATTRQPRIPYPELSWEELGCSRTISIEGWQVFSNAR